MKKSYIRMCDSPDIDLDTYSPFKKDDFGFLLQILVGIEGEQGEESFEIFICTPKWIEQNYSKETIILGLHTIIVQEYDYKKIIDAIEELFCISGVTWDDISRDLSYFGLYEFDYKRRTTYKNSVICGDLENNK